MRVGLYPGTFDPITNGHLDIIGRAVKLVDKLVIGVAINEGKGPLFTLEERVEILREQTRNLGGAEIVVQPFNSLLVHFAREVGARKLKALGGFRFIFVNHAGGLIRASRLQLLNGVGRNLVVSLARSVIIRCHAA